MKPKNQKTPTPIPDLQTFSGEELIRLRALLEVEMRSRNLAFSIGDIGENLIIDHYNSTSGLPKLQRSQVNTKNVDANSRNGDRYSIKTILNAKKTGTIYPDDQDREKQLFEYLLIVVLNADLTIKAIYEFPWKTFVQIRSWDKRMSAWYISCSKKNLDSGTLVI